MGGPAEATRCAGTTWPVSPLLPIAKYASSTIVSDGDVVRRFLATKTSGVCMIALYAGSGLFVAPVCTLIPSMPQGEVSPILDPRTRKLICPWDGGTSLEICRIAYRDEESQWLTDSGNKLSLPLGVSREHVRKEAELTPVSPLIHTTWNSRALRNICRAISLCHTRRSSH